jgi:hypothetical protein
MCPLFLNLPFKRNRRRQRCCAGDALRVSAGVAPQYASALGKTVAGLIGSGDRKSDQPMAGRLAPKGDYTELQFCQCWRYGAEYARFTIVPVAARCWPTV